MSVSIRVRRFARLAVFALAVVGALAGVGVLYLQLVGGALDDVQAYYDAGARLNAGLPLYPPDADPDSAEFINLIIRPDPAETDNFFVFNGYNKLSVIKVFIVKMESFNTLFDKRHVI